MQTTYTTSARRGHAAPEALVLHCSDHRFQEANREFHAEGLRLPSYALISMPGGGHFLSLERVLPKYAKIGSQALAFHVKRARPGRIVVIAHDDCLFFKEKAQFFFVEAAFAEKQAANLRRARAVLQERFPGLPIELYYAAAEPDGPVRFTPVG
jgi:hypothetical protein